MCGDKIKLNTLIRGSLLGLTLTLAGLVATSAVAQAQDLVAVVHEGNKTASMSKDKLKQLYLGQATQWDGGGTVTLIVQSPGAPASKALFKQLLKMAPSRFKHLWQEKELSGQGMAPKKAGGPGSVISKVSAKKGAIGVLLKSEVPEGAAGVKILPVQ